MQSDGVYTAAANECFVSPPPLLYDIVINEEGGSGLHASCVSYHTRPSAFASFGSFLVTSPAVASVGSTFFCHLFSGWVVTCVLFCGPPLVQALPPLLRVPTQEWSSPCPTA